jgi:DNA-binding transcriptional LysR family regulator
MWTEVELREIRVFLTLAEKLHFGRTAERLGITHSRVSQTIRTLEARVGAQLFERTSRRVSLTPLGQRFLEEISAPYNQLEQAFAHARNAATGIGGELRIGMYVSVNGGPHMVKIVRAFKARHPNCRVEFVDTGLGRGQFDWLRNREVDLLAMRIPIAETDITVGPVLSREQRVLAVANDHPLARLGSVSYEDIADYAVSDSQTLTRQMMDAFIPPRTPSGRLLRRFECTTVGEAIMRAASGDLVHPTVSSLLAHVRHPGITIVPIRDVPPSETALIWVTESCSPKIEAFVQAARDTLATTSVAQPPAADSPAADAGRLPG